MSILNSAQQRYSRIVADRRNRPNQRSPPRAGIRAAAVVDDASLSRRVDDGGALEVTLRVAESGRNEAASLDAPWNRWRATLSRRGPQWWSRTRR
jgi:hypothetical protein